MGMDVSGKAPVTKTGEYFRNNCWYWRPLWIYCEFISPELTAKVKHAHTNDGDGLGREDAIALSKVLQTSVEDGTCKLWRDAYYRKLESLPMKPCWLCKATGIRDDYCVKGVCNGCHGSGKRKHDATSYPFEVENVREFAGFLVDSGGFEIW